MIPSSIGVADDVLDCIEDSVVTYSPDGAITGWNAAAERLYGWDRSEIIGRPFHLLSDPTEQNDRKWIGDLKRLGDWRGTLTRRTRDGQSFDVSVHILLRCDASGIVVDTIDIGKAVGADQRAERELSEERYRDLFHGMPAAVWKLNMSVAQHMLTALVASGVDDVRLYLNEHPAYVRELMKSGRHLSLNERAAEMYDLESTDPPPEGLDLFWPPGTHDAFIDATIAAIEGKRTFVTETKNRTRGGREFDIVFSASYPPEMAENGIFFVSIIDNTDVKRARTALREREALYSDMFHVSAVSAWHLNSSATRDMYNAMHAQGVTDIFTHARANPEFMRSIMAALRVDDVNQETLNLFGGKQFSDIIGGSVEPFWFIDDCDTLLACIDASYRGLPSFRGETRMRTLDGRSIDVVFTMSASRELRAAGQTLIIIVDISDRVRAEAALAEMQANYTHAARVAVLGELTATIAHEVNQPLGAIAANGEAALTWLKSDTLDVAELKATLEDIVTDARRASDIIEAIRGMAVPAAAQACRLSLNELVADSVTFLKPQLKKADVYAVSRLQAGLPEIWGDPIQLQQVIVNLVLNASQAMDDVSQKTLELATMRNLDGAICLEVRDNGHGIPIADLPRIFDRFFTTKPSGMGIGLAICRSIVEEHGGAIRLENAVAGGTTVTLTFPPSDT